MKDTQSLPRLFHLRRLGFHKVCTCPDFQSLPVNGSQQFIDNQPNAVSHSRVNLLFYGMLSGFSSSRDVCLGHRVLFPYTLPLMGNALISGRKIHDVFRINPSSF